MSALINILIEALVGILAAVAIIFMVSLTLNAVCEMAERLSDWIEIKMERW